MYATAASSTVLTLAHFDYVLTKRVCVGIYVFTAGSFALSALLFINEQDVRTDYAEQYSATYRKQEKRQNKEQPSGSPTAEAGYV